MPRLKHNRLIRLIFFGNFFYGLCAVALSTEASLQQHYPVPNLTYCVMSFVATVVFYCQAYIVTDAPPNTPNQRSQWYIKYKDMMWWCQLLFTVILLIFGGNFALQHWDQLWSLTSAELFFILIFPFVAGMYYGINTRPLARFNLRNIGWLKPFIIGFTWAGLVTIYPLIFYCINHNIHYEVTLTGCFLFIKNFMYVTVLCIMFDIKDYAMDYNQELKTFVVKVGLRKTIFYIIIPLCLVGLGSFIGYALIRHFSLYKILINTIPFLLIITVAYSLHNRRSIFYYLIIIDGLMLVKACCGIIAMVYF